MARPHNKRGQVFRLGLAFALVLAVVAAGFLAFLPEAHACVHTDSDRADHHCWVTQFADHSVLPLCAAQPRLTPPAGFPRPQASQPAPALPVVVAASFPPRGPPSPPVPAV